MASVDYDPRKAHEYYMKHRKLKGKRRSTKGFSQTQKEQWDYAKAQLNERHQKTNEAITLSKQKQLEEVQKRIKEQKERLTKQAQNIIDQLRIAFKDMPPEQKGRMRLTIKETIQSIRDNLKTTKAALTESGKTEKSRIRDAAKKAKEQEKTDHESRLDKAIDTIRNMSKDGVGLSGSTTGNKTIERVDSFNYAGSLTSSKRLKKKRKK